MTSFWRVALVLGALLLVGCARRDDAAPPVATPTVTLERDRAPIGSPLEMRYRFTVAPAALALAEDYWVFVHFLDADRELMWTDDHQPPTPARQWRPGATIEYARTMFLPRFPYTGRTHVEIGLFSPRSGDRLPLAGKSAGQRAYTVATFELEPQSDDRHPVFRDGWHPAELADDEVGTEWQWSRREGTLTFVNPRRDATIYLLLDQPVVAFRTPQQVEVRIGSEVVDRFPLPSSVQTLRKIVVGADKLGVGEQVDLRLAVDRTFIPAHVPELKSTDPRELGVRVFGAYIEPR